MEQILNFLTGTQAQYDSLLNKDDGTLYFILDTHRIYRGEVMFASGLIENLKQESFIGIYGGSASDVIMEEE